MFFHICGQPSQRILPHRGLDERRPTKQSARDSQRHARPSPKVEAVSVLEDESVFENELRFDDVVDGAALGTEAVFRLPVRRAATIIGLNVAKCNLQILAAPNQHPPHGSGASAVQRPEGGISEGHIVVVAGAHRVRVVGLEGGVKRFDQFRIGVHNDKLLVDQALKMGAGLAFQ